MTSRLGGGRKKRYSLFCDEWKSTDSQQTYWLNIRKFLKLKLASELLGNICEMAAQVPSGCDEKFVAKNLLEEKGVVELLREIETRAVVESKPIIETILKHLDQCADETDRVKDCFLILRELRGLIAAEFLRPDGLGPTYELVFDTIKGEIDLRYSEKIKQSHSFSIYPANAKILKRICPLLFNRK